MFRVVVPPDHSDGEYETDSDAGNDSSDRGTGSPDPVVASFPAHQRSAAVGARVLVKAGIIFAAIYLISAAWTSDFPAGATVGVLVFALLSAALLTYSSLHREYEVWEEGFVVYQKRGRTTIPFSAIGAYTRSHVVA